MATNTDYLGLLKQESGVSDFDVGDRANLQAIDDIVGPSTVIRATAAVAITTGNIITLDSAGQWIKATPASWTSMNVLAYAIADIGSGNVGVGRLVGQIINTGWSWTPQNMIYLTTAGALVQEGSEVSGAVCVGFALTATSIYFDPRTFCKRIKTTRFGCLPPASGAAAFFTGMVWEPRKYTEVYILSDTATTGSGGSDNWQFTLFNATAAAIIAQQDTNVGGELAVNVPWLIGQWATLTTPNCAPGDVIILQWQQVGTPTALGGAELAVHEQWQVRLI